MLAILSTLRSLQNQVWGSFLYRRYIKCTCVWNAHSECSFDNSCESHDTFGWNTINRDSVLDSGQTLGHRRG